MVRALTSVPPTVKEPWIPSRVPFPTETRLRPPFVFKAVFVPERVLGTAMRIGGPPTQTPVLTTSAAVELYVIRAEKVLCTVVAVTVYAGRLGPKNALFWSFTVSVSRPDPPATLTGP